MILQLLLLKNKAILVCLFVCFPIDALTGGEGSQD